MQLMPSGSKCSRVEKGRLEGTAGEVMNPGRDSCEYDDGGGISDPMAFVGISSFIAKLVVDADADVYQERMSNGGREKRVFF
jgi:hypothetical protein